MIAFLTGLAGDLLPYIIAAIAAIGGLWGYGKAKQRQGMADERAKEAVRDAQANEEAHDRINKADTGAGATDDERIERLRDFAAKHGNRPAQKPGR